MDSSSAFVSSPSPLMPVLSLILQKIKKHIAFFKPLPTYSIKLNYLVN